MNVPPLLLLVACVLMTLALLWRRRVGCGPGRTISRDAVVLSSARSGLRGRPDRIVKRGRLYIPEEKKAGRRLTARYELQLGVYLILVEEHYGVRPPYGVIILSTGMRVQVKNTPTLQHQVRALAEQIRTHRQHVRQPLSPPRTRAACLSCSQRLNCDQRLA